MLDLRPSNKLTAIVESSKLNDSFDKSNIAMRYIRAGHNECCISIAKVISQRIRRGRVRYEILYGAAWAVLRG